jgi:hypothetical protein
MFSLLIRCRIPVALFSLLFISASLSDLPSFALRKALVCPSLLFETEQRLTPQSGPSCSSPELSVDALVHPTYASLHPLFSSPPSILAEASFKSAPNVLLRVFLFLGPTVAFDSMLLSLALSLFSISWALATFEVEDFKLRQLIQVAPWASWQFLQLLLIRFVELHCRVATLALFLFSGNVEITVPVLAALWGLMILLARTEPAPQSSASPKRVSVSQPITRLRPLFFSSHTGSQEEVVESFLFFHLLSSFFSEAWSRSAFSWHHLGLLRRDPYRSLESCCFMLHSSSLFTFFWFRT